jgi:hypothetical protein
MVTTRVKPRGPFYACKHARTHARVLLTFRAGIPAQDGGCYLAFDSVEPHVQQSLKCDVISRLADYPAAFTLQINVCI